MLVEAHELARPPAAPHQPQSAASLCLGNTARAKASAADLLGEDSGNYYLYAALGWVISLAGQHKVGALAVSLLPTSICPHLQAFQGLNVALAICFCVELGDARLQWMGGEAGKWFVSTHSEC